LNMPSKGDKMPAVAECSARSCKYGGIVNIGDKVLTFPIGTNAHVTKKIGNKYYHYPDCFVDVHGDQIRLTKKELARRLIVFGGQRVYQRMKYFGSWPFKDSSTDRCKVARGVSN